MPYIDKNTRAIFADGVVPRTAGELNYKLTTVILAYLNYHGLAYQTCNDIVGALENAKNEFQRRVQHPYEDQKIKDNGDVYEDVLP